jgi:hypothetical protein
VWDSMRTNMNIMGSNLASDSSYPGIITVHSGQVRLQEKAQTHIYNKAPTLLDVYEYCIRGNTAANST